MTDDAAAITRQYGGAALSNTILGALQSAGKDLNSLTRDDLAAFDELHSGGRDATRALGKRAIGAGLRPAMRVLDVGSGVGGPARTLAAEFGVEVVGLDLVEAYCNVATMLTARVGLDRRVTFRHGSALDMPFPDSSFDVIWSQNTIMNVADKARLVSETARVLRPGGLFVLEAIFAGPVPDPHFPVFWADEPAISFLVPPVTLRQLLKANSLRETFWEDVTSDVVSMTLERQRTMPASRAPLGLHVVYSDVPRKAANVLRNFQEGRTVQIQTICRREA